MTKVTKAAILAASVVAGSMFLFGNISTGSVVAGINSKAGPAEIYATNCASCHGSDGRAKTGKGKRTGATDLTGNWNADEARGIRIISNGKDEMPAFKRKLNVAEIRGVLQYVRGFKR